MNCSPIPIGTTASCNSIASLRHTACPATAWALSWLAKPWSSTFMKVLDCLHICPQRAGQMALRWTIDALPEWRAANRQRINERAAAMRAAFDSLPEWHMESLGAYFAYVRHPFAGVPSARVAEVLATERGALCLPGSAFGPGQDGHLRIAFANTETAAIPHITQRLGGLRLAC